MPIVPVTATERKSTAHGKRATELATPARPGYIGVPPTSFFVQSMIPKSGHRFSEKIMLNQ
jgi:hypothetical protein